MESRGLLSREMTSPQLRFCRFELGFHRSVVQQHNPHRRAQRPAGLGVAVVMIATNLPAVCVIGCPNEKGLQLFRDQRGQNDSHGVATRRVPARVRPQRAALRLVVARIARPVVTVRSQILRHGELPVEVILGRARRDALIFQHPQPAALR